MDSVDNFRKVQVISRELTPATGRLSTKVEAQSWQKYAIQDSKKFITQKKAVVSALPRSGLYTLVVNSCSSLSEASLLYSFPAQLRDLPPMDPVM